MQDRFKFRFWHKTDKRIQEWGGCHFWKALDNEENLIPMQCTGLKDKNGKLIFEGDIVKNGLQNDLIEWYKGGFWINGFTNGAKWNLHQMYNFLEVIGNVYENPELLEGSGVNGSIK